MTPPSPKYETRVTVRPDPADETMLIIEGRLTRWEGMTTDGRQRTGYVLANALRKHFSEAATAIYPVIKPPAPREEHKKASPPSGGEAAPIRTDEDSID